MRFPVGMPRAAPMGVQGRQICWAASPCRCRRRSLLPRSPGWIGIRPGSARGAGSENPDAIKSMTKEEALAVLGLGSYTNFEDVVRAKNRQLSGSGVDEQKQQEVEAAYDLLLMMSMRKRVTQGEAVPTSVRFADVPQQPNPAEKAQEFLRQLPAGGVSIQAPTQSGLVNNALVFVPLVTWAFLQGLILPEDFPGDIVPGIPIAIGAIWTLYSFREYRIMKMGKAFGYTCASLLFGAVIGGLLESLVRVDLHPLGAFHSPTTFVGEFALLSLWASATLLA
ncbi:unnamed protein product [Ostreobium quekettii]|uniref:Uncharacterized protein n=1 Tax=Ostreobium quekettii TaxID=121088 RepID=A0A8S1J5R1_9CHLO|nr:unnamed protein product [Ostreobium quekettii]|eukprot:evm.model.scf_119EXC.11 EVM.evm.TU.scf_119EXC.11   scf_119EXC:80289-83528(-)